MMQSLPPEGPAVLTVVEVIVVMMNPAVGPLAASGLHILWSLQHKIKTGITLDSPVSLVTEPYQRAVK